MHLDDAGLDGILHGVLERLGLRVARQGPGRDTEDIAMVIVVTVVILVVVLIVTMLVVIVLMPMVLMVMVSC